MKRWIFALWAILIVWNVQADNKDLEQLFQTLDAAIQDSAKYTAQKQQGITDLKLSLAKANNDTQRYDLYMSLFKAYKSYVNDSAVAMLNRAQDVAIKLKRKDLVGNCLSLKAFQCSTTGLYPEALSLLQEVDTTVLNHEFLMNYYIACNHVYGEMGYYSNIPNLKAAYFTKAKYYEMLLLQKLDKKSPEYLRLLSMHYYNNKQYAQAMEINNQWLKITPENSRDFAVVAYYRYLIYNIQGQKEMSKYWLTRSAICDIVHAVMDQGSLWSLANILGNEGDLDRAYRYISFSWVCASTFGTRIRSYQISPILSVIERNYQEELATSNKQLRWLVAAVSLMIILLLALLYDGNRHRKRLAEARNNLNIINQRLKELNNELQFANDRLDAQNKQLLQNNDTILSKNAQLYESNRVKEEYIGRFLGLCSHYIDKIENIRKRVNKLVKSKQYEELYNWTKSTELKEKELDELYENFDETFLHLFPDFVKDFNSLLRPEEHIVPPGKQSLNTTLRIFALIRLGIDDSSKIAEFLHYSVNTIYNYRARVKNGALVQREDFEKRVKQLGTIEEIASITPETKS